MKIGVYVNDYSNPESGGKCTFEQQVVDCFLSLAEQSNHTFSLLSFKPLPIQKSALPSNVEVISFQSSVQGKLRSNRYRSLINQIRKLIPSNSEMRYQAWHKLNQKVLEAHGIELTWSPWQGCFTTESPYITTVFDLAHRFHPYFPEVSQGSQWESRENWMQTFVKRASFIITGTQAGKSEIEKLYQVPSERIKVIPFPTPQFALDAPIATRSLHSDDLKSKYNLPEGYLFYPAQFWSHKNHANLLYALNYLKQEHNLKLPVVFVGAEKGNFDYIQTLTKELDLVDQVRFLGFVSQQDLVGLYQNAFALAFVTFFGPDNLPPLEAFALGCPVIASNVSGAPEQLGDAALLVDPQNTKQIALAIKSLYDDTHLRETLIQRGLERAARWTSQDYVKRIFEVFDEFEAIRRCWRN